MTTMTALMTETKTETKSDTVGTFKGHVLALTDQPTERAVEKALETLARKRAAEEALEAMTPDYLANVATECVRANVPFLNGAVNAKFLADRIAANIERQTEQGKRLTAPSLSLKTLNREVKTLTR